MKDNFSIQSDLYAKYRPQYPTEFFEFINSIVENKFNVWDCGTGNGQVASVLSNSFENVFATDISQSQISNAVVKSNIHYSVQSAEKTDFEENFFDLIITAQAIHWFNFEDFYNEAKRTSKMGGLICVIGYGKLLINKEVDTIISNFYSNIIGSYWDVERKYLDEEYKTIPFPFEEIQTPKFNMEVNWDLNHLIGYFNTWSAVKHYINQNGINPVFELNHQLEKFEILKNKIKITFPLFVRLGRVNSIKNLNF